MPNRCGKGKAGKGKSMKRLKRLICAAWIKWFLWILRIISVSILWYVILFVGYGNTYLDEVCFVCGGSLIFLQIVRAIIKNCL